MLKGCTVGGYTLGLRQHGRLPRDAEPGEIFEHSRDEFRAGTLRVEIFVAQEEGAVVFARAIRCGEECGRVAEVEEARGRWREATDVNGAHAFDNTGA